MAKVVTRWFAPCGCNILVEPSAWQSKDTSEHDVHAEKICLAHTGRFMNDKELFLWIYHKESKPMMAVLREAQKINPSIQIEDLKFTFDKDRKLSFEILSGMSLIQKQTLMKISSEVIANA